MDLPFDTRLRLHLYRDFVETGRPPSTERLADSLQAPLADVRAGMERLAAGRAIVLQPESRELMMATPLSALPTPYLVRVGSQSYFGACVWDALGIIAMLRRDATLETSCPCCGEALAIEAVAGRLTRAPGIIHFGVPARRWWENIVFS